MYDAKLLIFHILVRVGSRMSTVESWQDKIWYGLVLKRVKISGEKHVGRTGDFLLTRRTQLYFSCHAVMVFWGTT